MNVVLLCAGYGTRLYPLTENTPKSLLSIAGRPLIDILIQKLEQVSDLKQIVIVSNARFYRQFCNWQKDHPSKYQISIVNDQTTDNDNRLGAIRDLKLGVERLGGPSDLLVLASDNLFDMDLGDFVSFARSKKSAAAVGVYDVKDRTLAQKYGLIKTDSSEKIIAFLEKPKDPPTTLASMGIYYFPKDSLRLIDRYLSTHQNPDAPGFYVSWLIEQMDVYAFRCDGTWFDIGDVDSYRKADEYFKTRHAQKD